MAAGAAADAIFASIRPSQASSDALHVHHPDSGLTDEHLSALRFLFDRNLERALRILERGGVQRIVAEPSQRTAFKVMGETKAKANELYICFPTHFCSCQSFWFDVVNKEEQLRCKHQLAASLANALQMFRNITVTDEEFAVLLYDSMQ